MLAEAGLPNGFKTLLNTIGGWGPDFLDAAQLVQRYLKGVGVEGQYCAARCLPLLLVPHALGSLPLRWGRVGVGVRAPAA